MTRKEQRTVTMTKADTSDANWREMKGRRLRSKQ
jgi:hypothetical protein